MITTVKNSVSRRNFLRMATTVPVCASVLRCRPAHQKPNLLFLWTDEQRADTMRVYGNSKIHAPSLNKLADQSVVFRHAYVSQPVCSPSRSTVMTGLWPHTSGCVENNIPLPVEVACLPEILNDPDYRTAYLGKWHLGDEIFAQHGFQEWCSIEDTYRRFYGPDRDQTAKSSYWHFLRERGYEPETAGGDFSRSFAAGLSIEHCKPAFLRDKAVEFLRRHGKKPFMLYVNFLEPHMPFSGPLNDEHSLEEIDFPQNFDDPLEENEPLRYRLLREHYRTRGFEDHDLMTEAGWRRLITNYWGLVAQVDRSVGTILQTLDDLDLDRHTIVVYTSDHGDMMGSHQLLAKTVMYEESVKVPLLLRMPGYESQVIESRVSHIDLVPTLLDLMGGYGRIGLPGRSLLPRLRGESGGAADVMVEWNPDVLRGRTPHSIPTVSSEDVERVHAAHVRALISQDGWKLCLSDQDCGQLFDLNRDPYETTNLYDVGEHQSLISDLRFRIETWQRGVEDEVKYSG